MYDSHHTSGPSVVCLELEAFFFFLSHSYIHSAHNNGRIVMDSYDKFSSEKKIMGEHKQSLIIKFCTELDSVVPKGKMKNNSQLGPCSLPSKTLGTLGFIGFTLLEVLPTSMHPLLLYLKRGTESVLCLSQSSDLNLFSAH